MIAGFIFTNDKIIELEKTDTGTKVSHNETFKGLMAALMKGQMEKGVPPMLNTMNEALKKKAEQYKAQAYMISTIPQTSSLVQLWNFY